MTSTSSTTLEELIFNGNSLVRKRDTSVVAGAFPVGVPQLIPFSVTPSVSERAHPLQPQLQNYAELVRKQTRVIPLAYMVGGRYVKLYAPVNDAVGNMVLNPTIIAVQFYAYSQKTT